MRGLMSASSTPYIVVLSAIPSASDSTTTVVNTGCFRSVRTATRRPSNVMRNLSRMSGGAVPTRSAAARDLRVTDCSVDDEVREFERTFAA